MLGDLSAEDRYVLERSANGADVWNRVIAQHCRDMAKRGLVRLTKAKADPPGHKTQPYFGIVPLVVAPRLRRYWPKVCPECGYQGRFEDVDPIVERHGRISEEVPRRRCGDCAHVFVKQAVRDLPLPKSLNHRPIANSSFAGAARKGWLAAWVGQLAEDCPYQKSTGSLSSAFGRSYADYWLGGFEAGRMLDDTIFGEA